MFLNVLFFISPFETKILNANDYDISLGIQIKHLKEIKSILATTQTTIYLNESENKDENKKKNKRNYHLELFSLKIPSKLISFRQSDSAIVTYK